MRGSCPHIAALIVVCLACGRTPSATRHATIGVLATFPDGRACLAVPDSGLTPGQPLSTASIPLVNDSTASAPGTVEVTTTGGGLCAGLWGGYGWADYLVREIHAPVPAYGRGPAIALVGGTAEFSFRDGRLQTDLDGDGVLETFRSCTSNEGLHLTLWAGTPLQSQRLWHHYYALGYDVEPSCSPADYEEP